MALLIVRHLAIPFLYSQRHKPRFGFGGKRKIGGLVYYDELRKSDLGRPRGLFRFCIYQGCYVAGFSSAFVLRIATIGVATAVELRIKPLLRIGFRDCGG